jgi:hypothetical protein
MEFTRDQIIEAIRQFLNYGEETYNPKELVGKTFGHRGYFSGDGWAASCLRAHLEELKKLKP